MIERDNVTVDFHQGGVITNIHSLYDSFDRKEYLVNLERKLEDMLGTAELPCFFHRFFQKLRILL